MYDKECPDYVKDIDAQSPSKDYKVEECSFQSPKGKVYKLDDENSEFDGGKITCLCKVRKT